MPQDSIAQTRSAPEPSPRVLIPVSRVIILSILSSGLYIYYWFYITWKHYRDHTGDKAYPVWHALSLLVPIYDLFRTHAHMRAYKELMLDRSMTTSISLGWAVFVVFTAGFVGNTTLVGQPVFFGIMNELPVVGASVWIITTVMITLLLATTQNSINKYWEYALFLKSPTRIRIGVGEVIIVIIGLLGWLGLVIIVFSPAWFE